jgi:uncharacterized membrane protein
MIDAMKAVVKKDTASKVRSTLNTVLCSEEGQALVEHSLIIGSISGSLAIVRDNPFLVVGIAVILLIILLLWKPKLFATVVFIVVLTAILFFIYRWVQYGHI